MNSEDNTTLVTLPQVFDFAMAAVASPIVVDTSTTSTPMSTTENGGTSQLLGAPVVITLLMLLFTVTLH